MESITAPTLSDAEVARYHDQGYVIPAYRLPPDQLAGIRDAVDRTIAEHADTRPEYLMNPHMLTRPDGPNPYLALARDARILDMVERLIGTDIILWITRILAKPAGDGQEVPWHQDGQYWPIRPLATCSVWIAIDPATPANGCMRFIPRSHKRTQLVSHHVTDRPDVVLREEVDDDQFDAAAAVDVVLEPGQVSLHDVRMIHGSTANVSPQRRAALIQRYMPASSLFDRGLRGTVGNDAVFPIGDQPLFLMRGTDRAGNDFDHGHPSARP